MSVCAPWCLSPGRKVPIAVFGMTVLCLIATGCAKKSEAKLTPTERLPPQTAKQLLEQVVETYHQADSYQDEGRLVVRYTRDGEIVSETSDFALAVSSPNRMRMRACDALAVCDGQNMYATIDEEPGEVLTFAAPEELSPVAVYGDPVLGKAFNQVVGSVALALFLDPNPLVGLLYNAQSPQFDTPEQIGSDTCYRVRIDRHEGPLVLWIDQKTLVVRRAEYPPDGYRRLLEPLVGEITDMTITAELESARLNPVIDDATFQFKVPKGAELVKRFDALKVGSRIPKFTLRMLDGQVLTRESLADKIVVIKFWQTDDVLTFLDDLSGFDKVRKRYQDNDSIVFLAVSADLSETSDDELRAALERVHLSLPIARIDPQVSFRCFALQMVPTTVLLGRDGTLQEYIDRVDANEMVTLPKKLDTLLAGGDLYLEAPEQVQDYMFYSGFNWQDSPPAPDVDQQPFAGMAPAEIAPRRDPDVLRMKRLWWCGGHTNDGRGKVKRPGNVLAVPGDSLSDRVFVLDGSLSVAEIDAEGRMLTRHRLELPYRDDSAVAFLRTAADASGNRYILGSKAGVQQVHLFDGEWKRLLSFPEQGSHPGVSDAALADLDGDGTPEMLIGYTAEVGVHAVTLEGQRLWRNREADNQPRLGVGGPDRDGRRQLLAAQGMILPIDWAGRQESPITLPDAVVRRIFTDDLDGDQVFEWCAIGLKGQPPADVAVGLSPDGTRRWTYRLPEGAHHHQALEMVASGKLLAGDVGQWVIAGADGSIHILDIDGRLIDRLNYGAALSGMAIAKIKGQPALILATDESVSAWQFEGGQKETGDGSR